MSLKNTSKEELLTILLSGAEVWNSWRKKSQSDKFPNLSGSYLKMVDLSGANLSNADLSNADLSNAKLSEAKLERTNLKGSNFFKADLRNARLINAYLDDANFEQADLTEATLFGCKAVGTNFNEANLSGATLTLGKIVSSILSNANLSGADLNESKLINTKFINTNLSEAKLDQANLTRATLLNANLFNALLTRTNFSEANLSGANLSNADLRNANLPYSNFSCTNLSGVKLWANTFEGWVITEVECTHIYTGLEGKTRIPKNSNFNEGEFQNLYTKLPSFEYIFENGIQLIDTAIMDLVVQEINRQNPELGLAIETISMSSSQGVIPSIKFTVKNGQYLKAAEHKLIARYEGTIAQLEIDKVGLEGQIKAFQWMVKSSMEKTSGHTISAGDNAQILLGDNNKQTFEQRIENSSELTGEIKQCLLEVFTELQKNNAPPASQTELDTIKTELEKPAPDKGKLKKSWDILVEATPTLTKWYDILFKFFS